MSELDKNVNSRYRLWMPDDFALTIIDNPEAVEQVCNGVGSGLLAKVIPDTIWFMDATPSSDIHDWMYTEPEYFENDEIGFAYKRKADRVFLNNICRQVDATKSWRWIKYLRKSRARKYYFTLKYFGGPAFWNGKTIGDL